MFFTVCFFLVYPRTYLGKGSIEWDTGRRVLANIDTVAEILRLQSGWAALVRSRNVLVKCTRPTASCTRPVYIL